MGESPDAVAERECGGGSKSFFRIPCENSAAATELGRGEEPGGESPGEAASCI